jgi:FkbM family methyltransferase
MMTGPLGLKARYLGRKLGLNSVLARLFADTDHESRFATAIARCTHRGDIVWDIGANTGSYALAFSNQVGGSGRIFAFEPSPRNLAYLHQRMLSLKNVVILPFALSDVEGEFLFKEEPDGTTSHIITHSSSDCEEELIAVQVRTGDDLISKGVAAFPNIIKVDVEGHELKVLLGLSKALGDTRLKGVFVEVHFSILHQRGTSEVPRRIEQILTARGFRVAWTDHSHLQAVRL